MIQMTDFHWLIDNILEVSMHTVAIIVIVLSGFWLSRSKRFFRKNKLGISGVIIWTNKGHETKPQLNKTFGIFGKPEGAARAQERRLIGNPMCKH